MNPVDSDPAGTIRNSGHPIRKKRSVTVDMTAMVDVAFLLLVFFVLLHALAIPKGMLVNKPPVEEELGLISCGKGFNEEEMLTLILGGNDSVYYFQGNFYPEQLETADYSASGIRQVIAAHLHRYENLCGEVGRRQRDCWDPIFVVKPSRFSRYQNLVDILDELRISGARKYSYTEMTSGDDRFLAQAGKE